MPDLVPPPPPPGPSGQGESYLLRAWAWPTCADYWITTSTGRPAFQVRNRNSPWREAFRLDDPDGHPVVRVRRRHRRFETMTVHDVRGVLWATVRHPLAPHPVPRVELATGTTLALYGDPAGRRYRIATGPHTLAHVHPTTGDTCTLHTTGSAPIDAAPLLALALAIDWLTQAPRGRRRYS
jgi:uncharacterized protein YxjI